MVPGMVPGGKFVLIHLGNGPATKLDEFLEKCQRGGGIFNPKIYVADFGNFGIFDHEFDTK